MKQNITTLGESCEFFNGKAHEKDIDPNGQYVVVNSKFISSDGVVKKWTKKQMFPLLKNDIVMVMSDVPNGQALAKCAIIEDQEKYSLNQRICAIRTSEFDTKFLYYQLNRHPYLLSFNNGENQTNLRKGDILKCPLWRPSYEEQKQIVAILDQAFAKIDKAKANIEHNIQNAKDLFQSQLNQIFSQKGEGWEEKQLGDVAVLKGRIGWKGLTAKEYTEEGPLFLSVHSLNYGDYVDFRDAFHITDERYDESPEIMLEQGDVLICKDGAGIGKLGIVGELPDKTTVNSSLLVIRPTIKIKTEYLYFSLLSPFFQKIVQGRLQGATTPHLYQRDITTFPIYLPPIEQQSGIIETIVQINRNYKNLLKRYGDKISSLDELKKSILQNAFAGELTNKEVTVE